MSAATVRELLADAARELRALDSARLDAELLLASLTEHERSWFHAYPEAELPAQVCADFRRLVVRRADDYPLAYLTGLREFWSLTFEVDRSTLIPRPETELLVEAALGFLRQGAAARCALDLGTGCGAIAIALALDAPQCLVTASDVSRDTLAAARRNATRLGAGRVRFVESDWYAALGRETFDLIACNPPYVADDDPLLVSSSLRFEPRLALDGGRYGLASLHTVIAGAPRHLVAGGRLLLEHGAGQGAAVRERLALGGFVEIATLRDAAGHERVTQGMWS